MGSLQLIMLVAGAAVLAWANRVSLAKLVPSFTQPAVPAAAPVTDRSLTVDEHIAALQRYFAVASKEIRTPALDACDELHAAYDKTETISG